MRWGLVPFWAKDIKIGFSTINAMAETVDTKPVFREAFVRRRCIVPVDTFYEWKKLDAKNQAALCDCARGSVPDGPGRALGDLEVAGQQRDDPVVHHRHDDAERSVCRPPQPDAGDPAARDVVDMAGEEPAEPDQLKSLLVPYTGEMVAWPVSQRVGNVKNNDASLIEPILA